MVFSSIIFLFLFLPTLNVSYFLCLNKLKLQNTILMLFSMSFYYWGEKDHILIMLACIFINYLCGIFIQESLHQWARRLYLTASIITSLSLLMYFKYFNFFLDSLNYGFNLDITNSKKIALPLGISFYTFHALSYVIDVYWRKVTAERNFITFSCYVSFFPQLVAGPIVRYSDIKHSFYHRYITRAGMRNGMLRFCFGLGKKVLVANEVAKIADYVFALPTPDLTFAVTWLGAIAYTLQIYFDFSGYSDMAIGLGLMFGFRYKENFNIPYNALSIQEFWRKWHISLSSWFRDYVYIPLGGSHQSISRTYINLITIFGLCGLWHGANYTFVVWGLFHGFFLILERTKVGNKLQQLPTIIRHAYVFIVVTIGWVFFRQDYLWSALEIIKRMLTPNSFTLTAINGCLNIMTITALIIGMVLSFGLNQRIKNYLILKSNITLIFAYKQASMVLATFILLTSILFLSVNSYNPFLYFKF